MPHTSHKRQKVLQKRQEITDRDGWTHVTKGFQPSEYRSLGIPRPVKAPTGLTLEKINEKYQEYTCRWQKTTCCAQLEDFFKQNILTTDSLEITACFCLGLGSLTENHSSYPLMLSDAALYELIALKTILNLLNRKHLITNISFQDPRFNETDEDFIKSMGYTVLQHPQAIEQLTDTSFLFTPRLEFPIILDALNSASPAMYMGNDLELTNCFGDEQPVFRTFLNTHSKRAIPGFELNDWCDFQAIYWKSDLIV